MSLTIPQAIVNEIVTHALADSPKECCGFLAGRAGNVTHRLPLINSAATPETRFESSPDSTFVAMKQMRQMGIEIVAVYHSHPNSEPVPSKTDCEWNYSRDVPNVIVSLIGDRPRIRAWCIDGDGVSEIPIS